MGDCIKWHPKDDGQTHINVYSKGATLLGRDLTNFAGLSFYHPTYGRFDSVEGFWFWLRTLLLDAGWSKEQREQIEKLKTAVGYNAKKLGNSILDTVPKNAWDNFPEDNFREEIVVALEAKLEQNDGLLDALVDCPLPLTHYYYFGDIDNPKVQPAGHQWVIQSLENIRARHRVRGSKQFLVRLETQADEEDEPVMHCFCCSGKNAYAAKESVLTYIHVYLLLKANSNNLWTEDLAEFGLKGKLDKPNNFTEALLKSGDIWTGIENIMTGPSPERIIRPIVKLTIVNENGHDVTNYLLSITE